MITKFWRMLYLLLNGLSMMTEVWADWAYSHWWEKMNNSPIDEVGRARQRNKEIERAYRRRRRKS